MANPEIQLVSHIITNGNIERAIEWGMTPEDFLTDEGRAHWNDMISMRRDPLHAGGQFGVEMFTHYFKTFKKCHDDSMTLEAYCTLVRKNRLQVDMRSIAHDMADSAENGDPMMAAIQAQQRLKASIALGFGMQTDVNFSSSLGRIIDRHDRMASGEDLSICQYPWKPFNDVALGIMPDDYIVFYGRPKSMKSWVLAYCIAHVYNQGKLPLIYTKEMTADNIFMRVAACLLKLPYQDFRTGKLTKEDIEIVRQLRAMAKDLLAQQKDMICLNAKDAPGGADTVEWLQSKVERYKPDLVAIDGLYLMSDGKGAKNQKDNFRVQNISRACRQMVLDCSVPVLATMQATRTAAAHKNANLDEIAFSDAISQDVTAAIRVINEQRDSATEKNTITLAVGGSREFQFAGCRIYGEPATDFGWVDILTDKEIAKVKQRDEKADEDDKGTGSEPKAAAAKDPKADDKRRRAEFAKTQERRISGTLGAPRRVLRA